MHTELLHVFKKFKTPHDIQIYLNDLKYNPLDNTKSPLGVVREKTANCSEGAFFAAAALKYLGHKPQILILLAEDDDDHLLAVFQANDKYGCIAKSNTTTLRYREPVYLSVRELVMSFFDMYFNIEGKKSLRKYSGLIDMDSFKNWINAPDLDHVWDAFETVVYKDILNQDMIAILRPVDPELMKACFMFSDPGGLYKPKKY